MQYTSIQTHPSVLSTSFTYFAINYTEPHISFVATKPRSISHKTTTSTDFDCLPLKNCGQFIYRMWSAYTWNNSLRAIAGSNDALHPSLMSRSTYGERDALSRDRHTPSRVWMSAVKRKLCPPPPVIQLLSPPTRPPHGPRLLLYVINSIIKERAGLSPRVVVCALSTGHLCRIDLNLN